MKVRAVAIGMFVAWFAGHAWIVPARADGGTLRAWDRLGSYEVAVFTAPTPLAAGPIDVSVLILKADTGEPVNDAQVRITATPRGRAGGAIHQPATKRVATNKLMYAALFDLPDPGSWDVDVGIGSNEKLANVRFTMTADNARPEWFSLLPWVCWPFPVIAIYAIHQRLIARRPRSGTVGV